MYLLDFIIIFGKILCKLLYAFYGLTPYLLYCEIINLIPSLYKYIILHSLKSIDKVINSFSVTSLSLTQNPPQVPLLHFQILHH